jgi:hypothetical protein
VRLDEEKGESEDESEPEELQIKKKMSHNEGKRIQPHKHTKKVCLCEDVHDKFVTITKGMTEEKENGMITCLQDNQDVFAWIKRSILNA